MKRLNIHIVDELHTRVKIAVAIDKTDISEVVRKLLEKYVEEVEKKKLKK
jgi:metal-responsive CopG/Arc/MetJ family transcriptional regulator